MGDDDRSIFDDRTPMDEASARALFAKRKNELRIAEEKYRQAPSKENEANLRKAKILFTRSSWYFNC